MLFVLVLFILIFLIREFVGEITVSEKPQDNKDQAVNSDNVNDTSHVEVSDDVIKASSLYQSLLSESVSRRQKIKQLEAQLQQSDGDKASTSDTDDVTKPQTNVTSIEALLRQQMAQIEVLSSEINTFKQTQAERELSVKRQEIASRYGLQESDVKTFLTGDDINTLEAQAKRLSEMLQRQSVSSDTPMIAGSGLNGNIDDIGKRIFERIEKGTNVSPFDSALHRRNGGVIKSS